MDVPIHYVTTSDGVSIAVHAMGEGTPLVVVAPIPWTNCTAEMQIPAMAAWWTRISPTARIIRYDGRGTGLSDRSSVDFSLDAQLRDLDAVVSNSRVERCALLGAGPAGAAAVAYAAIHSERVSHLILWNPILNGAQLYPVFDTLETLAEQYWDVFTETFAHTVLGWDHSAHAREYAEFLRACVTREAFIKARPMYKALDATRYAAKVRARTLVLARTGWAPINLSMSRDAASRIEGARLLLLEGDSGFPMLGDADAVAQAQADLLAEPNVPVEARSHTTASLTPRETEVLRLLAGGRTGKEIAAELSVSLSTAQRHIANIYTKIGARSRVDAATYALSRGLVDPN